MKKSAMVLSLVLPALIAGAGQADAKHRGFLETNNQVSDEAPAAMATNPSEAYKTRAQDNHNNAIDNVKDYAGDKAEQAGDYISDKASDARDYAKEKYNNAKKYVKEKTGDAEDHIKDKKAEHKDRHDKKMKNKGHWLENERHDIDEDYQEALYKIKKSQLPDNLKELLRDQAEENRSLALEQAEDRAELMKKHKAAREEYRDEFMKDKSNRKAVKEVMNIL